jgi:hypothetical protein
MLEIHVRYQRGVDPRGVALALVENWRRSERPALCIFDRSGPGRPADPREFSERLVFRRQETIALGMRTGRARSNVDTAELFFTNPEFEFPDPANYCLVSILRDVTDPPEGYRPSDLVRLLADLVRAGPVQSGYIELLRALEDARIVGQRRRAAVRGVASMHWITYWRGGIPVDAPVQRRDEVTDAAGNLGTIIQTCPSVPTDLERHVKQLLAVQSHMTGAE